MIRDLFQQSLRSLRNARGVTATSICLLATTIGAITAIYAVVHAVVLRPFGFADQESPCRDLDARRIAGRFR
jgi:hypothetical protein